MEDYQSLWQQYEQNEKQERKNAQESVRPVLNKLLGLGVEKIEVNYSGSCDSGYIDDIIVATADSEDSEIVLPASDRDLIEELIYTYLPGGWEINYGSEGIATLEFEATSYCVSLDFDHYWLRTYDENTPYITIKLEE